MTTEEIEKAVSDYSKSLEPIAFKNLKGEEMPYLLRGAFKEGVEFANKHWQEKTRWIPVEERLPEIREKEYMIYAKNNNVTYDYAILLIDTPDSLAYLKLAFTHWKEVDFPNY